MKTIRKLVQKHENDIIGKFEKKYMFHLNERSGAVKCFFKITLIHVFDPSENKPK